MALRISVCNRTRIRLHPFEVSANIIWLAFQNRVMSSKQRLLDQTQISGRTSTFHATKHGRSTRPNDCHQSRLVTYSKTDHCGEYQSHSRTVSIWKDL